MSDQTTKFWAIVAASGIGRRMQGSEPKQYLKLIDRTVIEWSLAPFVRSEWIAGIVVAISKEDTHWRSLALSRDQRIRTTLGGDERVQSVANALDALGSHAQPTDWVLVHDAARPCLAQSDLQKLKEEVALDDVGGILAVPLADTLKRAVVTDAAHAPKIASTVSRENLWRALTPQMFQFKRLHDALQNALAKKIQVTDEASAIEALGYQPRLIEGRADNIKITVPADLQFAEQVLRGRGNQ